MKLLVGRYVLMGCLMAVLVLADDDEADRNGTVPVETPAIPADDPVTEKPNKFTPDLTQGIKHSDKTTTSPNKNPKVIANPGNPTTKQNIVREIVVIHDHDHDHHGYHNEIDHHQHEYHHSPPPRQPPQHHHHDHPHHPPPNYHHYPPPYPGYYTPPHYVPYSHGIMPHPYAAGAIHPPPQYPYYPPPPGPYYNPNPMKPSATIIESSSTTSSSGQNLSKPTDILNQGTDFLWNLFDKLGDVTEDNQEVVAINSKPVQTSSSSGQMPPTWYSTLKKKIMFRKRTV